MKEIPKLDVEFSIKLKLYRFDMNDMKFVYEKDVDL